MTFKLWMSDTFCGIWDFCFWQNNFPTLFFCLLGSALLSPPPPAGCHRSLSLSAPPGAAAPWLDPPVSPRDKTTTTLYYSKQVHPVSSGIISLSTRGKVFVETLRNTSAPPPPPPPPPPRVFPSLLPHSGNWSGARSPRLHFRESVSQSHSDSALMPGAIVKSPRAPIVRGRNSSTNKTSSAGMMRRRRYCRRRRTIHIQLTTITEKRAF